MSADQDVVNSPEQEGSAAATESWHARRRRELREEKERAVAVLDRLRELATTEVRDGREYLVVRIPDAYGERPTGGTLNGRLRVRA